ncbi:MAG: hypothetical protein ACTSQX_16610 [Candidatus Heimdallarchaeota archaeon]
MEEYQRKRNSRKYIRLFVIIIALLLTVNFFKINNLVNVGAKENTNTQNNLQKKSFEENLNVTHWGKYDTYYGKPYAIQTKNDLIYVSDICGDVQILALDNNEFELVGYYKNDLFDSEDARLTDKPASLCLSEDYLFLTLYDLGIAILNITNPENPILFEYYENITADEIYVSDNTLYTLKAYKWYNTTFSIYDISSIHLPFLINNITYDSTNGRMEFQNDFAFIKTYRKISVLNITDPYSITEISYINKTIGGFSLYNNYLVLTNVYSNLTIYNITDKLNPVLHANLQFVFNSGSDDICISNKKAYVANMDTIYIFNIANISNPKYIDFFDQHYGNTGIPLDRLILTNTDDLSQMTSDVIISYKQNIGLVAYNLTIPSNPIIYASYFNTYVSEIKIAENFILVGVNNKLKILSKTNQESPELICTYEIQGNYIYDIIISDDIVYLATYPRTIEIINMQIPTNPVFCSIFTLTGGSIYGIEITLDEERSILYVSNEILTIIDVRNSFNPLFISSKSFSERSGVVFYKNNLLFIGVNGGDWNMGWLGIYNVENPREINYLGGIGAIDGVRAIFADNNYFYFSYAKWGWMRGLAIYDYSNISSKKEVYSSTNLSFISEIKVKYNILYLIKTSYDIEDNMIITLNISDINNIKEVGRYYGYTSASKIQHVEIFDQYIYISEKYEGVQIYKFNEYQEEVEPTTTSILSSEFMQVIPISLMVVILFTKKISKKKKWQRH